MHYSIMGTSVLEFFKHCRSKLEEWQREFRLPWNWCPWYQILSKQSLTLISYHDIHCLLSDTNKFICRSALDACNTQGCPLQSVTFCCDGIYWHICITWLQERFVEFSERSPLISSCRLQYPRSSASFSHTCCRDGRYLHIYLTWLQERVFLSRTPLELVCLSSPVQWMLLWLAIR